MILSLKKGYAGLGSFDSLVGADSNTPIFSDNTQRELNEYFKENPIITDGAAPNFSPSTQQEIDTYFKDKPTVVSNTIVSNPQPISPTTKPVSTTSTTAPLVKPVNTASSTTLVTSPSMITSATSTVDQEVPTSKSTNTWIGGFENWQVLAMGAGVLVIIGGIGYALTTDNEPKAKRKKRK